MTILLILGILALAVGLVGGIAVLEGWAITVLWGWFAVPAGLPPVGLLTAIGLSFIAAILTHQYIPTPKAANVADAWSELSRRISDIVGRIFMFLLLGWLFRLLLP